MLIENLQYMITNVWFTYLRRGSVGISLWDSFLEFLQNIQIESEVYYIARINDPKIDQILRSLLSKNEFCKKFRLEMDSNVTVTGDNNESPMSHSTSDTNTRSEKHSRSKSQNFQYDHDAILSKHFDRSLNHSKSKSLPRPMTGKFLIYFFYYKYRILERGLPSSFFIEQNSSSSENLSKNRNEASRIRTRIRTKSKDQIAKSNSLSNRMNKIKSEPLSPMSSSHPSQQQPPMHHRSRSCPIQPITSVHPRVPARVKHQMPVPSPEANIPRSVDIEIDTNRIRLPLRGL